MAQGGQRRMPASLHVIKGSFRRDRHAEAGAVEVTDNGLEPPKRLTGRAKFYWDRYIRRAGWLTQFDAPAAMVWCVLLARFETEGADMKASHISQARLIGSELCLDPSSRARIGNERAKGETPKEGEASGAREFFG